MPNPTVESSVAAPAEPEAGNPGIAEPASGPESLPQGGKSASAEPTGKLLVPRESKDRKRRSRFMDAFRPWTGSAREAKAAQDASPAPTAAAVQDLPAVPAASSPSTANTAQISLRKLNKVFKGGGGKEVVALKDVDLEIQAGEFITLLGASGCGKTTLLRILAGLERGYEGHAVLDGEPILKPGRDRGVVFQDHRLLPWLNVEENVGFGLAHLPREERRDIAHRHIALVGLSGFEKSFPSQLSGGMAQRAAIARALATEPDILLMDEPLGALDALTRMYMQEELEKIWKHHSGDAAKPGLTVVMVTHDVDEALYLSDRVVVLSPRPGRITRILPIPLARPRPRDGAAFNDLKKLLLEEFHLSHQNPKAPAAWSI